MVVLVSQYTRHKIFHSNSITVKLTFFFKSDSHHTGSDFRLMHQCFSRNTANIDTRTTIHLIRTFYNSNFLSALCKFSRKSLPTFAETNNNNIKCFHIYISLIRNYLINVSISLTFAKVAPFRETINNHFTGWIGNCSREELNNFVFNKKKRRYKDVISLSFALHLNPFSLHI